MLSRYTLLCVVSLFVLTAAPAMAQQASPAVDLVARGKYLVTIMDCGGCHTGGALADAPDAKRYLASSDIGFGGSAPMGAMTGGVVYPPNLTPDQETGLGAWTDEQIMRAIRTGQRPDGRMLVPVMPWPSYATLTDEDARAIVAYLRSIPAVRFKAPTPVKPDEKATAPYLKVVREQRLNPYHPPQRRPEAPLHRELPTS